MFLISSQISDSVQKTHITWRMTRCKANKSCSNSSKTYSKIQTRASEFPCCGRLKSPFSDWLKFAQSEELMAIDWRGLGPKVNMFPDFVVLSFWLQYQHLAVVLNLSFADFHKEHGDLPEESYTTFAPRIQRQQRMEMLVHIADEIFKDPGNEHPKMSSEYPKLVLLDRNLHTAIPNTGLVSLKSSFPDWITFCSSMTAVSSKQYSCLRASCPKVGILQISLWSHSNSNPDSLVGLQLSFLIVIMPRADELSTTFTPMHDTTRDGFACTHKSLHSSLEEDLPAIFRESKTGAFRPQSTYSKIQTHGSWPPCWGNLRSSLFQVKSLPSPQVSCKQHFYSRLS